MDSRYTSHALIRAVAACLAILGMGFLLTSCGQLLPSGGPDDSQSPPATPAAQAEAPASPPTEDSEQAESGTLDGIAQLLGGRTRLMTLGVLSGLALVLLAILIIQERRADAQTPAGAPRDTARLATEDDEITGPALILNTETGLTVQPLRRRGVTIGRASDNDLVIDAAVDKGETVSDYHARIYFDMGQWIVKDLGSQNGVYVNDRRTGHNLLEDGWQLRMGGVVMTFRKGVEEAG